MNHIVTIVAMTLILIWMMMTGVVKCLKDVHIAVGLMAMMQSTAKVADISLRNIGITHLQDQIL